MEENINFDRDEKWRLILGGDASDDAFGELLKEGHLAMDRTLNELYGQEGGKGNSDQGQNGRGDGDEEGEDESRAGGLGDSKPNINRWLGDIRKYFPTSVVQIMQKDAMERLGLDQMLLEPELLQTIEVDVNLVSTLINLNKVMPDETRETAKMVVRKLVDDLEKRLKEPMKQAILGALNRSTKNRRPKHNEIDWHKTIQKNLKNYQPKYKTIIPENLRGFGKKGNSLKDIILCVDQSGSMAESVVYSGVFGSVLTSLPAVKTSMVAFDTNVTDLTKELKDPVDLLFGVQLGGGTDIDKALGYCRNIMSRPSDTIIVLITDLHEGGSETEMLKKARDIIGSGAQLITLLALSDEGKPSYDNNLAAKMVELGSPVFACTPDLFPEMMANAINKNDLNLWASTNNLT